MNTALHVERILSYSGNPHTRPDTQNS